MHKLATLVVLALTLAACDSSKIPGNISRGTTPPANDPNPIERLDPVIHCAPDTSAVAMAGVRTFEVAACAPPANLHRS